MKIRKKFVFEGTVNVANLLFKKLYRIRIRIIIRKISSFFFLKKILTISLIVSGQKALVQRRAFPAPPPKKKA